eukprot:TRINITY_DN3023_c0_g3_i2.p1 TRINITY_DN3023_c0_g3~~TRINITY_DN3023_c0_g3_i2.p1  ORF type:complete len:466 (+),score=154.77 TRINITY_DN3023_c0_g3_i2:33-1430(+)
MSNNSSNSSNELNPEELQAQEENINPDENEIFNPNQSEKSEELESSKVKEQEQEDKKRRLMARKKRKLATNVAKLPDLTPSHQCYLKKLKLERVHDFLQIEHKFVEDAISTGKANIDKTFETLNEIRGTPMEIGELDELISDDHAIVSMNSGMTQMYVNILSFVDRDLLVPGTRVLLHHRTNSVIGVLEDETDPMVSVMKVDEAPTESYADIGGLEEQIMEIRETIELPLTRPDLYESIGINPPKGVILYGPPGTGKTLLARAVARETSATFLRVVGSELIQKYLGEGPKLVRELFAAAKEMAPAIVFIDEIDAVGTKRFDARSSGEKEIQRTMLELLNQLDGFDNRGDVKVIVATNRIDSLDPALIRPGRIDRKIEFPLPSIDTKRQIFQIHTKRMTLSEDVDLDGLISAKDEISGADIKAICSEAGLLALRQRRMKVTMEDFEKARDKVLTKKDDDVPDSLYM